jgi:hypothetical protein
MRPTFILLPLMALAACGPNAQFGNLTCRNKMYADPSVKAAIAASPNPDTDPNVFAAKRVVFDDCTSKLFPHWDNADRGGVWHNR